MDADVEMVKRDRDDVGPAIELNAISPTESRLFQQNRWFAAAMVVSLSVLLFFVQTQYQEEVDRPLDVPSDKPIEEGDIKVNLDVAAAAKASSHLKPHYHHSYNMNKSKGSDKVQEWLDATVTLRDGVKYEVVQQLRHDKSSFTEGLVYVDGLLYESVGLVGESALLVLNATTGDTLERHDLQRKYFAEGLAHVDGKLIQLSYQLSTGFIHDIKDLAAKPKTFEFHTYTGEGWGLTYDPVKHELIVSDGSEYLLFWDPDTFKEKRRVAVKRLSGETANNINELEYWRGRVIANVWYKDFLLVIHPETGQVEKEYGALLLFDL